MLAVDIKSYSFIIIIIIIITFNSLHIQVIHLFHTWLYFLLMKISTITEQWLSMAKNVLNCKAKIVKVS
jgi:hypothetical protein